MSTPSERAERLREVVARAADVAIYGPMSPDEGPEPEMRKVAQVSLRAIVETLELTWEDADMQAVTMAGHPTLEALVATLLEASGVTPDGEGGA